MSRSVSGVTDESMLANGQKNYLWKQQIDWGSWEQTTWWKTSLYEKMSLSCAHDMVSPRSQQALTAESSVHRHRRDWLICSWPFAKLYPPWLMLLTQTSFRKNSIELKWSFLSELCECYSNVSWNEVWYCKALLTINKNCENCKLEFMQSLFTVIWKEKSLIWKRLMITLV